MAVVLENVSGRLQTFVLTGKHLETHPTHPHRHRHVKLVTVHHGRNGQLAARHRETLMADSLRLVAGEKRIFEDDLVTHCPEIKAAIDRREIRVRHPAPSPPADVAAKVASEAPEPPKPSATPTAPAVSK